MTIQGLVRSLQQNCTVVFITHDIAVANIADTVIVMGEGGVIIETGLREQLLRKPEGAFRQFASLQGYTAPEPAKVRWEPVAPSAAPAIPLIRAGQRKRQPRPSMSAPGPPPLPVFVMSKVNRNPLLARPVESSPANDQLLQEIYRQNRRSNLIQLPLLEDDEN